MKKYLGLFVFASLLPFVQSQADEIANEEGKVYLRPRAVRITRKNIFVFTENGAFKTPAVARDEKGLYVQAKDLEQVDMKVKGRGWGKCDKRFAKKNKFGRWKKWGSDQRKRRTSDQPIAS